MEDNNKLDLNKPLLSVRKQHTTIVNAIPKLPRYKPDIKSGPIRNPGTVPFRWEQTPGTPKEETKSESQNCSRPKLPPGRYLKADNKSSDAGECDDDEPEEEYVDARDTLSRADSSYLNCSISGLTRTDDFEENETATHSADQQIRDFIIERFLPAAMAMASETPKYAPKKEAPSVREQQPKQVKKTAISKYTKPVLRYGPSFAKRYALFGMDAAGDDEDEELFTMNLMNPVPGMSVRTRIPRTSMKTFKDLLADEESDSGSSVVERTVYVDTVKNVGHVSSSSSSSTQNSGVLAVASKENQIHVFDSSTEDDLKKLAAKSQALITAYVDSNLDSNQAPGDSDQKLVQITTTSEKLTSEPLSQTQQRETTLDNFHQRYSHLPPLPTSPSDSWLCRTLPSISGKHPSGRFFVPATDHQNYGSKVQSPNLVSCKVQEQLDPVPET